MASACLLLCLRAGVHLQHSAGPTPTALQLADAERRLRLPRAGPGLFAVLERLAGSGASAEECTQLLRTEGEDALHQLHVLLWRLEQLGWLCRAVPDGGGRLAWAEPNLPGAIWSLPRPSTAALYTLSRFACCRSQGGTMLVESALGDFTVRLPDWRGAAILGLLAQPRTARELAQHVPVVDEGQAHGCIDLLLGAGLACEVDPQGLTREDIDPVLAQWDYYDLLFHGRCRSGRHRRPAGATFRFLGHIAPLPAVKPPAGQVGIPLFRPCLEALQTAESGLTRVIETRRSIRNYGKEPIAVEALGEFLFRTARIREVWQTERGELSARPYPSAGACHPLEIYVLVTTCRGLDGGMYHYQPGEHRLYPMNGPDELHRRLLEQARLSMGASQVPQVLLVLSARFARLSWKYEALAYALLLKEVGILFQTMYLVATAMELAPCALGNGDTALFAGALGTDWREETSVGEFALGSRPVGMD